MAIALQVLVYTAAALACLAGLILSALSFSGTWLAVAAAALLVVCGVHPGVGWGTVLAFAVLSGLIEVAEALSASWGVRRRGGSSLAGLAAFVGGLLGLMFGGALPPPLIGSLLGMLIGSFALAFAVEALRLRTAGTAARVAWGAVMGRLAILLLKTLATLGMTIWLARRLLA
jgi:hypothetical protein